MVFFNLTGRRLQPFFQKASWFFDTPVCKPEPGFATTAIQSLCREGDIAGARKLFDEMPEKNVFSFSTMIYGYSSNGFFVDSLHLFSNMQDLQIHPNSYTFVALLLASAGLRNSKIGESIHGRVIKNGLEFDAFVSTALLNSYSKCGSVADAYRLFCASDRPSLAHWNAMIAGFVLDHLFEEALLLFERLKLSGAMPNCITMMSVTQGCLGHGSLRLSESVHGYIVKAGFESDLSLMNSVLDMYLSFGCLDIAGGFFAKMEAKDVISWTNMMGFMLDIAHPVDALQLFSQMRDSRIDVDVVAMMIVTSACTILGDLTKGRSVHGQIVVLGFGSELPVVNSLLTMYSSCGDLGCATILFDQICRKSLVSWTAMISGLVSNGQPREGLHLLIRMRREEPFHLDSVTLICCVASSSEMANLELCEQLHGCSFRSGLIQSVDVQNSLVAAYGRCGYAGIALRVFQSMRRRNVVSCNAMISSFGINGRAEEALSLFQEMENFGEKPDSITFVNALNTCVHSGMVDEGLKVFERMLKEEQINPRAEHYGCLVGMLARAGRLEEASKLAELATDDEAASSACWALLGGGHICSTSSVAEVAAAKMCEISSWDASYVVLLSNVYAGEGKFELVERLRSRIGKKSMVKSPGFSVIWHSM